MTTGHPWATALLRGLVTYVVLCLASYFFGASLFRALAPAFKGEIEALRPEYEVTDIRLDRTVVEVQARGTDGLQPGFQATVGYSFGFTYPILVLSLLAGWPFPSPKRRWLALGAGAALALVFMMIDVPAQVLLGMAEAKHEKPGFLVFFFDNGGRQFLALMTCAVSMTGIPPHRC
jgi:hypothetical protein